MHPRCNRSTRPDRCRASRSRRAPPCRQASPATNRGPSRAPLHVPDSFRAEPSDMTTIVSQRARRRFQPVRRSWGLEYHGHSLISGQNADSWPGRVCRRPRTRQLRMVVLAGAGAAKGGLPALHAPPHEPPARGPRARRNLAGQGLDELAVVQVEVEALGRQQLLVAALLDDAGRGP